MRGWIVGAALALCVAPAGAQTRRHETAMLGVGRGGHPLTVHSTSEGWVEVGLGSPAGAGIAFLAPDSVVRWADSLDRVLALPATASTRDEVRYDVALFGEHAGERQELMVMRTVGGRAPGYTLFVEGSGRASMSVASVDLRAFSKALRTAAAETRRMTPPNADSARAATQRSRIDSVVAAGGVLEVDDVESNPYGRAVHFRALPDSERNWPIVAVKVRYIVDTLGRVDTASLALVSTYEHKLTDVQSRAAIAAAKEELAGWSYTAATVADRPVRIWATKMVALSVPSPVTR